MSFDDNKYYKERKRYNKLIYKKKEKA